MNSSLWGNNVIIGKNVKFGKNVIIGHNCIIEDNVSIGDNSYIDCNTIIRSFTSIGDSCNIGCSCIIGEYWSYNFLDKKEHEHLLVIGDNSLVRSGSVLYAGSTIGDNFQTGHNVTIRENVQIGNNVSIGTKSDIQCDCVIGNYVRLHSNVFVAPLSIIDDFVWVFPYVVLTNDPTPPSVNNFGVHIHPFAIVAAGSIVLPGISIGQDCLIGAGSVVTKSVEPYAVVFGNPAKIISDVRKLKNKVTGEPAYPWRDHYDKYMPWNGIGFDTWFSSLDMDEKEFFKLDSFVV